LHITVSDTQIEDFTEDIEMSKQIKIIATLLMMLSMLAFAGCSKTNDTAEEPAEPVEKTADEPAADAEEHADNTGE
jgi:hypothetical protein